MVQQRRGSLGGWSLSNSAATRTLFLGGPNFLIWSTFLRVFYTLFIREKKKQKKIRRLATNCSTYFLVFWWFPSFLLVSKKRSPSWNCRKGKGGLGGDAKHFRGAKFLFRERRPLLPSPLVEALLSRFPEKIKTKYEFEQRIRREESWRSWAI